MALKLKTKQVTTQTAIDRVNMVRKRVELGEIKPTTKMIFKRIKQERRVEFALKDIVSMTWSDGVMLNRYWVV